MQILRIQYARVPKIRMLNHRFRPDSNHLMLTLDVDGYDPPNTNDFFSIYHALADLFPTLSKHSCCEQWENTPLYLETVDGVSVKSVGEDADVAHLIEHVMVDLQCRTSGMRQCSGITCGHRAPENRFDVFVECVDPRIGAFSARYATYLVAKMFHHPRLSHRYRDIPEAARLLLAEPELRGNPVALGERMGRCPVTASWCLAGLEAFGLTASGED